MEKRMRRTAAPDADKPVSIVETMAGPVGKRALITGASSGLGRPFADLLAARKVNLALPSGRPPWRNSPPNSGARMA
jgi:hypothetical protein